MKKYVIDGSFLTQKITGIQRYAYEILLELDKLVTPGIIEILVPLNAIILPPLNNIRIIQRGKAPRIIWQQTTLPTYLRKKKREGIFLTNSIPLTYSKGIVVLYDISYKVNPAFFKSFRNRLSMCWYRAHYLKIAHSKMSIVTVSDFSKSEIKKYYKVSDERIFVIYCAWQHVNRICKTENVFEKYPFLEKGQYCFSMSTLAANKNFKWILHAAKNNPSEIFAIAGGGKLKNLAISEGLSNLPNVFFLGYVSDSDAKSLMANCKIFLFPSLYEGFGLPPLEAIANGASCVLLSQIPSLKEVYGKYVNYICLHTYELPMKLNEQQSTKELLDKYSWKQSARQFYELIIKRG